MELVGCGGGGGIGDVSSYFVVPVVGGCAAGMVGYGGGLIL